MKCRSFAKSYCDSPTWYIAYRVLAIPPKGDRVLAVSRMHDVSSTNGDGGDNFKFALIATPLKEILDKAGGIANNGRNGKMGKAMSANTQIS